MVSSENDVSRDRTLGDGNVEYDKTGLERELESALASQLASSTTTMHEGDDGCVVCTNCARCNVLFPNKSVRLASNGRTVNRMSTMDTMQTLRSHVSEMESNV